MNSQRQRSAIEKLGVFRRAPWTGERQLYVLDGELPRVLSFFVPNRKRRWLLRAAAELRSGGSLQAQILVDQLREIGRLTKGIPIGVMLGTPGPYQKATALIRFSNDGFGAAKVAMGPLAETPIEREIEMLRYIQSLPALASNTPSLITCGAASGRRFLVQQVVLAKAPPVSDPGAAESLLNLLAQTAGDVTYSDSQGWAYLQTAFNRWSPNLPSGIRDQFESILDGLNKNRRLMSLSAPVVHRDFTRWNYAFTDGLPLLFDWEYSLKSGNPIQDLLHWYLLPLAVHRRVPSDRGLIQILSTAHSTASKFWPHAPWTPRIVRLLFRAYLMDVLLFYAEADNGIRTDSPVVLTFLKLLMEGKRDET